MPTLSNLIEQAVTLRTQIAQPCVMRGFKGDNKDLDWTQKLEANLAYPVVV